MPNMTDVEERWGLSLVAMEQIKAYMLRANDLAFKAHGEKEWLEVRSQAMMAYAHTQTLMHQVVTYCEDLGARGLMEHASTMREHYYRPIRGEGSLCAVCRSTKPKDKLHYKDED